VAASFRPLRLAKYLPELDYRVWVISATAGSYPSGRVDSQLAKEIPPSVRVTRIPNLNPLLAYERHMQSAPAAPEHSRRPTANTQYSILNIKSRLAELAKFPDIDAPWAAASLLPALYLVLRNRIDVIYSSAPPFGAHLLGLALARITGRPWIAHYGNPWTANPSIHWKCAAFGRGCERLDRAIVRRADAILVLDEILADCIRDLGRQEGVHVHPNGFDPAHFAPTDMPSGKFTITYAGSLYNMHDPRVIYDALSLIERNSPSARADMRIVFAGPPESDPLREGAPADVEFPGPLGHSALACRLNDSHVLLEFLTASAEQKFTVPCKLYEYMAARRPILAVTPEGPLAQEVRRLNLGRVVSCDDPAAVARAILDFHSAYKAGTLRAPNNPAIEAYLAPNQARDFARVVEEVCRGADREPVGVRGRSQ
jgi:glycosyltransferase involved in cell wall biosynthesis